MLFKISKMSIVLRICVNNIKNKSVYLNKNVRLLNNNNISVRNVSNINGDLWKLNTLQNSSVNNQWITGGVKLVRFKYNQKKGVKGTNSQNDEDSDVDEDNDISKDPNLIRVHVNSLRSDLILKAGLGLARNKVEAIFYESKIRVNGEKIFKKSLKLNVGDEIDIIKGLSVTNPNHLVVARVEIVAAVPKEENILVKLRRNKSLTIENYPTENSWKPNENSENN